MKRIYTIIIIPHKKDFDKLCDCVVAEYVDTCRNYRITEEEILVPKTIKVLEPVG